MFLVLYIFFQIVGESFPVSSSGHLIFLQKVYCFFKSCSQVMIIPDGFDHMLHLATVLVCVCYFFRRIYQYCILFFRLSPSVFSLMVSVIIIDSIAIIMYPLKSYGDSFPLWLGFLITGITLYRLRFLDAQEYVALDTLSLKSSFVIACAQMISFLPGVSRFGLTFFACRFQKLSPSDSFFFSFLIALPLFCAAGIKGAIIYYHASFKCLPLSDSFFTLFTSIVLATLLSYYSFIMVGSLIRRNKLWYISYYMFSLSFLTALYALFI